MENVLLHSCCAPCSAAIVEWMLAQDIRPTLYYFNPNIFPQEEYEIRKSECSRYAQKLGLEIIDGDYDHTAWLSDVAGLEDEPERGKRCLQCFKIRLLATAKLADEGKLLQEHCFSKIQKPLLSTVASGMAPEASFYNQQYCGCEFSFRKPQNNDLP